MNLMGLMRTMMMVAIEGSLCSTTFFRSSIYHIEENIFDLQKKQNALDGNEIAGVQK
jgi:hypothetical protein